MGVGWMCTEGVLFLSISFLIGREVGCCRLGG